MREVWSAAPIVEIPPPVIPRARCPYCSGESHTIVRTMPRESDGSQTRRCVCNFCSQRFLVVLDPDLASAGKGDLDAL